MMPYPYTLMPDGHTLEPEDVVKPPAETQEEPTSTYSPHLDFGNPPPPTQQPAPTEQSTGQASSAKSDEQSSTGSSPREIRPPAPVHRQPILVPPDILDISEDAGGSLEQHIAALYDGQPIAGSARPIEPAPTPATDEFGNRPLTPGQEMDVDYLLSFVTDTLARDVLITMKRDGIPPRSEWNEFMAPYALWSWDAESDAQALTTLAAIAQSDWDETFAYADADYVETVAQDQGDDRIEGLVIINARTGDILLDRTGVVRDDGSQYVGLQDTELEALRELGLELIFIHNHPNGTEASAEDLDSAFRAGAELLIVITPQGQEFVYIRGRYGMVKVRDEKASYEVGLATLRETRELVARSKTQARAYLDDSPEFVFLQKEWLWWELRNVPVTYITSETMAQVAARMGIPVEHLQELNPGGVTKGVMRIPLPGWHTQIISDSNGRWLSAKHFTGATFLDFDDHPEIDHVVARWESLSPVEQQIEMALIGSNANVSRRVPFANRFDFDDTLTWIHDREDAFKQAASDFGIPVAQLKMAIQSELLYDYDSDDQLQDDNIRSKLNTVFRGLLGWAWERLAKSWDGAGVGNVHYPTLIDAYRHAWSQLKPGEIHPWYLPYLDSETPHLFPAPEIYASDDAIAEHYGVESVDDLEESQVETARYLKRIGRLHEVPWDLREDIADYLASDVGSIRAAAMVIRMYNDELRELDSDANIEGNSRDMARVWGRYRSSKELFDYGGNARLAHPLADYWSDQEYEEKE